MAPEPQRLDTAITPIATVRSPAYAARPRRRHWGLMTSFLFIVCLPLLFGGGYLFTRASDQFASTVGFSVIKQELSSPLEVLGGVADFGTGGVSDADILYEFITSQEIVEILDERLGLSEMYSKPGDDPIFAYDPNGTIEDLHDYWTWMVRVIYDDGTGLIEVRALAFDPDDAKAIATGVFEESARLVEEISAIAQDDTTRLAQAELDGAAERLRVARENLTAFRSQNQIVDPSADIQGQMGLLSTLEGQLAEALIAADLLRESTRESDPRITQADLRIAVIEARIEDERRKLGVGSSGEGSGEYANIVSEFERLTVDREFAEQTYVAALATYDQALAEARRKSRYVAAHINPTLAQSSQFPQRYMWLGAAAFFLLTLWSIGVLAYYSFRDRR